MRDRLTISYRNSMGRVISFADQKPLVFLNASGLDGLKTSPIYSKAPYQIGKTFIHNDINERDITINVAIITENEAEQEEYKRLVTSVFNPLLSGTLELHCVNSEKSANVIVTRAPIYKDEDYREHHYILECQITLTVPEGFLDDLNNTIIELTQVVPMIEFPFEVEIGEDFEVGTMSYGAKNFYNDGEAPTPFILEIFGYVKTPKLINVETGDFIEIHRTILDGEVLYINTSFADKYVRIVKNDGTTENAFHYINMNSTFFNLNLGDNKLEFDAEEGNDTAGITIYYKRKWGGI